MNQEAGLKVKKESSFEILFVDNKYEANIFDSSPVRDRQFQNISKSFTVLPEKYDAETLHSNEDKTKLNFSASLQHLTSSAIEMNLSSYELSDLIDGKNLKTDKLSNEYSEHLICSLSSEEDTLCCEEGPTESDQNEEKRFQLSDLQDDEMKQTMQIQEVQNSIEKESFGEKHPVDNYRKESGSCEDCSVNSSIKANYESDYHATFEALKNVANRYPARFPTHTVEQIYPKNKAYPELCPLLKPSLKIYKWIRDNKYLQNLVTGAKSTFHSFLDTVEMEINTMLGIENHISILIISNVEDSIPFKEALLESFDGQVILARCSEKDDLTTPALPVGYDSALRTAQSIIDNTRQGHDCTGYNVILSSATFVTENVPQRWQMCTALCLEDLRAGLNLHNFSATTPIPNEYIGRAMRLTPEDYPLIEFGLAVTLKEATAGMIQINSNDMQEFLSGVNNFETLKSAAKVLAGMYSKYISKYSF